jgi:hypothetical protein
MAECRWPLALWIEGEGRFGSLSACPPGVTVMLFGARADAERAKRMIDATACGGQCWNRHRIVDLAEAS